MQDFVGGTQESTFILTAYAKTLIQIK